MKKLRVRVRVRVRIQPLHRIDAASKASLKSIIIN